MTLRFVRNTLLIILIAQAIISCKKDSSNSPDSKGRAKVSYFAKASGTRIKSASTIFDQVSAAEVSWSTATIFVDKISFVGKSDNLIDTTVLVQKNINLLNPNALTGIIELPSGSYKDVKVKMFLRKNNWPEVAFYLKGTFINTSGGRDSLLVGSSLPLEVNLSVPDITIDPSQAYNVTFSFDLDKGLTGITNSMLQTARNNGVGTPYVIYKGGSQDEPLYDQVVANWQTVATATIVKE